jgi:NadR type nicotinamide-nucleotide adenylyltransferase
LKVAHPGQPLRVVLIGPESTGKTWLACDLAAHYAVPWAPEHAREYLEAHEGPLGYADVDAIGQGQKTGEDAAVARAIELGAPLVVLDTDLLSTVVYSRHYYAECPEWIEREARSRLGDLYLLHHVDVDWRPDGHQRAQPQRREELFARFQAALEDVGVQVCEAQGSWNERKRRAIDAIDRLLS